MIKIFIGLCPENWYYYDQNCWYFSDDDEKVPFDAAQDLCKKGSEHSNLLSIHEERVNGFVADVAKDDIWIGLQIKGDGDYKWLDNSAYDYNNWKDGGKNTTYFLLLFDNLSILNFSEPDDFENQQCTALNHQDATWSSEGCDQSKGFMCHFTSSKS